MRKVKINSVSIFSRSEKTAFEVNFDSKYTIILGELDDGETNNRYGKSLLMKSIYYGLGAELTQYTQNWSELKIATIINLNVDECVYEIFRKDDTFVIRDNSENCRVVHNIGDLRGEFADIFNFDLFLETYSGVEAVYPGGMLLPFYIDQDQGWGNGFKSFKDIGMIKSNASKDIIEYYCGIKPSNYHEMLKNEKELKNLRDKGKIKLESYREIRQNHIERTKEVLDFNVDIDCFREEIFALQSGLKQSMLEKQEIKNKSYEYLVISAELKRNYDRAIKVLKEAKDDAKYMHSLSNQNTLICPTCGIEHENTIEKKFYIYGEIDECKSIASNYKNQYDKNLNKISQLKTKIEELEEKSFVIKSILKKKRDNVTLEEILDATGAQKMLVGLENDIQELASDSYDFNEKLASISKQKSSITRKSKPLLEKYHLSLNKNVDDLDIKDFPKTKNRKFGQKLLAGGVEYPNAILADFFAINKMIKNSKDATIFPLLIDTPLQQDPGTNREKLIFEFIENNREECNQLIVATTRFDTKLNDWQIIKLKSPRKLLDSLSYENKKNCLDFYQDRIYEDLLK
jgi:uncharacterized Zn finger protein (UPF0148 family)